MLGKVRYLVQLTCKGESERHVLIKDQDLDVSFLWINDVDKPTKYPRRSWPLTIPSIKKEKKDFKFKYV